MCALVVGAVIFRPGLPLRDYLNPVLLLVLPRFIPFGVAAVSAVMALVYLCVALWRDRPLNVSLTLVHFGLFLAGIYGHVRLNLYMSRALDQSGGSYPPLPVAASLLSFLLFASILIFLLNVALTLSSGKTIHVGASQSQSKA